jgi:hypothetical protein
MTTPTGHDPDMLPDADIPQSVLDRREAIRRVSMMLGGVALVGGSALWNTGCTPRDQKPAQQASTTPGFKRTAPLLFSAAQVAMLNEVADTILPTTTTPGAKAAQVGEFMNVMVTDCYTADDQKIFSDGMTALDAACTKAHGHGFMQSTPAQRTELLTALDKEQYDFMKAKKPEEKTHYFRMMKELTMLGYFTSEIGYTKAMRYRESPGPFQGCVPYTAGETIWADHA